MIIVLDSTSKSIRAVLGEAHTTNPVDFTITYAESTLTTRAEKTDPSQSNGVTNMEVLGAPASGTERAIAAMTVFNNDTVDHLVTVYLRVTATDYGLYSETVEAGGFRFLDDLGSSASGGAGDMVLASIQTVTGAKTFADGTLLLAGSTSGTSTLKGYALGGVTLSLPAPGAPDTLVSNTNTATLTNKTLTSPTVTGASITTTYVKPTADGASPVGEAGTAYSALYLATGATINLGASDVVLTHSSNTLTITGGDLVAPNVTATTAFLPDANDGAALGTTALQFSDLFLAEGGVINFDNGDVTVTQSGNTLTVAGGSLTAAIAPRVVTTTDDSTAVIDLDATDRYHLTAIANATTISTTGTLVSGKARLIRLKDAGVAKGLTWDAAFRAVGVTLPTTTVAGKTHYILGVDNTDDSKVDVIAVTVQA